MIPLLGPSEGLSQNSPINWKQMNASSRWFDSRSVEGEFRESWKNCHSRNLDLLSFVHFNIFRNNRYVILENNPTGNGLSVSLREMTINTYTNTALLLARILTSDKRPKFLRLQFMFKVGFQFVAKVRTLYQVHCVSAAAGSCA